MAGENVVCAIDFGTTFSGFSYRFPSHPETVYVRNDWGYKAGIHVATKTPTSLLITPKNEYKIGYEAIVNYSYMQKPDQESSRYFDQFKMKLRQEARGRKLTKELEIADHQGRHILALEVFGKVLNEMKMSFVQNANKQLMEKIDEQSVLWVITVPAIWTDGAKQFMREAAVEGQLVDDANSKNLQIALEPEAASLACICLPVEISSKASAEMGVGTEYMVMDAGGGTLDITVHKVLPNKELEEVYFENGTAAGGAQIDQAFLNLLDEIFEKPLSHIFRENCPAGFVDFVHKFEPLKKSFDPEIPCFNVNIPGAIPEVYSNVYNSQLKSSIKDAFIKKGVTLEMGVLRIPSEMMMSKVFEPTLSAITMCVRDLLKKDELERVSVILMVGGLSCSKILQAKMEREFGKKYRIIIPNDASSIVVKGASFFGLNQKAIRRRMARRTYGVEAIRPFDETKHDGAEWKFFGDVKKAVNLFEAYILRGEKLDQDYCIKKRYRPSVENQRAMYFKFFTTLSITPRFTSEEGMEEIGTMTVEIPEGGGNREVEVTMSFGGTCIQVQGRDTCTDKIVKTSLDFLSKRA